MDAASPYPPQPPTRRRSLRVVTWGIALLGPGLCVALLRELGTGHVLDTLKQLGPWLPSVIALELGRMTCEWLGTRTALGGLAARLSPARFWRGQLLGQCMDVLMPAGRATSETAKAAVFSHDIGLPQAAALATALQLAALVANACLALLGFAVSRQTTLPAGLSYGLLAYAAGTTSIVIVVVVCAAAPRVRAAFRRARFVHDALERFAHLIRSQPRRLLFAVGAQVFGRVCQGTQLALLTTALAAPPEFRAMLLGQAVYLVGAALGDLVPMQLGTTDAVFVYAAGTFGLPPTAAMAVTLAMRAVQVIVAVSSGVAALGLWLFSVRRRPEPAADPWVFGA
jgi:uncharacterized membrane protein YbhN (UPF0104 family)